MTMNLEILEGFFYGVAVASLAYLVTADHFRQRAKEAREAAAYFRAMAENAAWALAVERSQIRRERERARTELADSELSS